MRGFGWEKPLPAPDEQGPSKLHLQVLDETAHGPLRQVELAGSTRCGTGT
jgi:hypothetical protein